MKKKLLALFALVLTASQGAWAETVLPTVSVSDYNANGCKGYVFKPGTSEYTTSYGNWNANLVLTSDRAISAKQVRLFGVGESLEVTTLWMKAAEANSSVNFLGEVLSQIKVGQTTIPASAVTYGTMQSIFAANGFPCGVFSYNKSLDGTVITMDMVITDGTTTQTLATQAVTLSAVAAIGDTYYTTLASAIAAANEATDAVTIELLSDYDMEANEPGYGYTTSFRAEGETTTRTNMIAISGSDITFDLGGHTISNIFNNTFHVTGSNITFTNGTMQVGQLYYSNAAGTKVYTSENEKTCSYIMFVEGATNFVVDDLTTYGGINIAGGSTATINNLQFSGTKFYAVCSQGGSVVTLNGGTYDKSLSGSANYLFWVESSSSSSLYVKSGNYIKGSGRLVSDGKSGSLQISGGLFDFQPAASYLADGYEVFANCDTSTSETYPYMIGTPVATVVTDAGATTNRYCDFAAAWAAATSAESATVTMVAGYTLTGNVGYTVPETANVTLDLNGHTLTQTQPTAAAGYLFKNEGTLTLKDSTDENEDGTGDGKMTCTATHPDNRATPSYANNLICNNGVLNVESGYYANIKTATYNYAACYVVDNYAGATANISGGKLYASAVYCYVVRQFLNSTTADNTLNVSGTAVLVGCYGAITMQLVNSNANAGALNISGGTITSSSNVFSVYANRFGGSTARDASNISVSISGGTINGGNVALIVETAFKELSISGGTMNGISLRTGDTVNTGFITGGTFKADVSAYVADGYAALYNATTKLYTIGTAVAKIGTTNFGSLADAIDAVPTDGTETTITMVADVYATNTTFTVAQTQNITLDLNGCVISQVQTNEASGCLILNQGTLTLKDSSDTEKDGSGTGKLYCMAIDTSNSTSPYSPSWANNLITNKGTLSIESGYYDCYGAGAACYVVDNMSTASNAKLTVNGGKLEITHEDGSCAIRIYAQSETYTNDVTVNGGVIIGIDGGIWIQQPTVDKAYNATLTVTDGTISGHNAGAISMWCPSNAFSLNEFSNTTVTVTGGKFSSDYAWNYTYSKWPISLHPVSGQTDSCESVVNVSGGIWDKGPDSQFLADGYAVVDNTDDDTKNDYPYTIDVATVAQIGETKYTTLDAAYDAAETGDTITLIADITYDADREVPVWTKAVNIDLGGYTLTTESGVSKDLSNMGYKAAAICFSIPAESAGTVKISNGTIVTAYGAGVYADDSGLTMTLENLTIRAATAGTQSTAEYSAAVRITSEARVVIDSGSYTGKYAVAVSNSGGTFDINGGTFAGGAFFSNNTGTGVTKSITIADGAFTGDFVNPTKGTLSIANGIFSADPADYVIAGYESVENTDDDTKDVYPYTVGAIVYTATFKQGDVDGISGFSVAETTYTVESGEIVLPMPTYTYGDTTNVTFSAWTNAEGVVCTTIPAGTTSALTFGAKWTSVKAVTVDTEKEGSTSTTSTIKVTEEWVDENVGVSATTEQIQTKLNETQENGLKGWQNYVLGLEPTGEVKAAAEQGSVTAMPVANTLNVPTVDTGFTVTYSLDQVAANGAVVAEGETNATDDITIDLSSITTNAYFKLSATITANDESGASVKVTSTNTIGVLVVTNAPANAIIPVPWASMDDGKAISVSNLVRTANLTPGDTIYAYSSGSYTSWTLGDDYNWKATSTYTDGGSENSAESDSYTIPRGSAVWLTRQDATKPVYLVGAASTNETATTGLEAGTTAAPSWNLVGNPTTEPKTVDELIGNSDTSDKILIPTKTVPKNYSYNASEESWGYWATKTVTNENSVVRVYVESVWKSDDNVIPAGQGFWYLNATDKTSVDWSEE